MSTRARTKGTRARVLCTAWRLEHAWPRRRCACHCASSGRFTLWHSVYVMAFCLSMRCSDCAQGPRRRGAGRACAYAPRAMRARCAYRPPGNSGRQVSRSSRSAPGPMRAAAVRSGGSSAALAPWLRCAASRRGRPGARAPAARSAAAAAGGAYAGSSRSAPASSSSRSSSSACGHGVRVGL